METGDQLLGKAVTIRDKSARIVGIWAVNSEGIGVARLMLLIVDANGKFGLHEAINDDIRLKV